MLLWSQPPSYKQFQSVQETAHVIIAQVVASARDKFIEPSTASVVGILVVGAIATWEVGAAKQAHSTLTHVRLEPSHIDRAHHRPVQLNKYSGGYYTFRPNYLLPQHSVDLPLL